MPLKLVTPRPGKSPNWTIRGTHLGVSVNRTAGTPDKKLAARALAAIKDEIERGAYSGGPKGPTFASAALRYIQAGGERRFVLKLAEHFGETPLEKIDQAAIDEAAFSLYPHASVATRNRQVYSPVSAILKLSGIDDRLRRPKGSRGNRRIFWLTPDQAGRLLDAAAAKDAEFGIFLAFLLYTGCRLSEVLGLDMDRMNLCEAEAYVPVTKSGEPRLVHLPPVLVAAIASHPRGLDRKGKLFHFGKNGRLYVWLDEAAKASGVEIPDRVAFHAFRHTWATWMRRFGKVDTAGLVETGAWRSRQAAAIYEHLVQHEEAKKADHLPQVWKVTK
jgi:integrase